MTGDPAPAFGEINVRQTLASKTCRHCGEQKSIGEFPINNRKRDGLSSWCRACHADACARWRAKHPEKIDAYNAGRRAEYAAMREAELHAARKVLNKRLREQVRQNRERDERRGKAAA
jgi:hypothetical protein